MNVSDKSWFVTVLHCSLVWCDSVMPSHSAFRNTRPLWIENLFIDSRRWHKVICIKRKWTVPQWTEVTRIFYFYIWTVCRSSPIKSFRPTSCITFSWSNVVKCMKCIHSLDIWTLMTKHKSFWDNYTFYFSAEVHISAHVAKLEYHHITVVREVTLRWHYETSIKLQLNDQVISWVVTFSNLTESKKGLKYHVLVQVCPCEIWAMPLIFDSTCTCASTDKAGHFQCC